MFGIQGHFFLEDLGAIYNFAKPRSVIIESLVLSRLASNVVIKVFELYTLFKKRFLQCRDGPLDAVGALLVLLQSAQLRLVHARILRTLLAKRTDRIQRLGIARHFKDLVKAFLEYRWLCQWPIGFFLMAKKDMLKNRARHT